MIITVDIFKIIGLGLLALIFIIFGLSRLWKILVEEFKKLL